MSLAKRPVTSPSIPIVAAPLEREASHGFRRGDIAAPGSMPSGGRDFARRARGDSRAAVAGGRAASRRSAIAARSLPLDHQWELQFLIYQCVTTSKSVKYHEKYHTRSRSPASKLYPTIGSELHTTNFIEPLVIAT